MLMRRYRLALICACVSLMAAPAHAQGQSQSHRPPRTPRTPQTNKPKTTGTAGRTALPIAGIVLASWLDDADTLEPGRLNLGVSIGRWTSLDGGETEGPAADVSVGVLNGVQLGASLPYYRASYSDGFNISGLGDSYFVAKLRLIDPGEHAIGVAVAPTLEVLSESAVSDTTLGLSRVNFAFPISVEIDRDATRVYATGAYFTRGATSLGGAVEHTLHERVTLAGTVTYSHTTRTLTTTDLADLSPSRTDVSGGIYFKLSPSVTATGSLGRTISRL
ncbi:MAG TPA: hypothetical protein VEL79_10140, partial [Vicinamibacterales bacterium]|nr:hypothetical protein [Vicinamibacterales bacterium]